MAAASPAEVSKLTVVTGLRNGGARDSKVTSIFSRIR
jgi:hypothetical protein